jgi:hypothetical protein
MPASEFDSTKQRPSIARLAANPSGRYKTSALLFRKVPDTSLPEPIDSTFHSQQGDYADYLRRRLTLAEQEYGQDAHVTQVLRMWLADYLRHAREKP